MIRGSKGVTVTILKDGELASSTFHVPIWVYRVVVVAAVVVGVLLVLGAGFYGPIARQAARVPGLERDVERLTLENGQIRQLAQALDSVEASYDQLRQMVGADIAPDPVLISATLPVAPTIEVVPPAQRRRYEPGLSVPRHWPLDQRGYVTRGQVPAGSPDEAHPGIDVAVPVGALVRATSGGTVLQTGDDPEYGLFVLLQHPSGYQSMYGHLSRVVANQGQRVRAGEVIGRSGNTGRSSAPHLHFEIRHNGVTVDPMTLIRENR
ncbi:MAG: M23 family metallopeptidase [Gemmatimonadales bacterium]|nr:M23 family metallopeptidase [Gemmatimonadales bacterium]